MNHEKIILQTSTLNLLTKSISFLSSIYFISKVLPNIGQEYFGFWMTLLSLLLVINFIDFGIINSLMNKITFHSINKNKFENIYVYAVITLSLIIGILLITLITAWAYLINQNEIFDITHSKHDNNLKISVIIFAFHAAFAFMINAYGSILLAKNQGWIPNIILFLVNSINIIGIYLINTDNYGLIGLFFVGTLSNLIGVIIYVYIFIKKELKITKKIILRSILIIKSARNTGYKFIIIQIGVMALFSLDPFLISLLKGASDVTIFTIIQKIYSPIIIISTVINTPLWPVYANANYKKEYILIKKILLKYLFLTLIFSILYTILIIIFKDQIFKLLLNDQIVIDTYLILWFGIFSILLVINNLFCTLSNGIGKLPYQVKLYIYILLIMFPVKIMALSYDLTIAFLLSSIFLAFGLILFISKLYKSINS